MSRRPISMAAIACFFLGVGCKELDLTAMAPAGMETDHAWPRPRPPSSSRGIRKAASMGILIFTSTDHVYHARLQYPSIHLYKNHIIDLCTP